MPAALNYILQTGSVSHRIYLVGRAFRPLVNVGSISVIPAQAGTRGKRKTQARSRAPKRLDGTDPEPGTGIRSVQITNAGGTWSAWQRYAPKKDWTLSRGAGAKTVYVSYRDAAGNVSARASDSVTYRP